MSLAIDLQNYLAEIQGLAQLHVDLAKKNLVPQVRWKNLATRTEQLRKRVEASIDRKRSEEKEA